MEPTLHMQQGLNLVNRVLQFYPIMKEGETSTVTLTEQDWMVLMDLAENTDAREHIPATITDIAVDRASRVITLKVPDCTVKVTMGY